MKFIYTIITIGLLTTALTANAEDENVIITKKTQVTLEEGSSEHNRMNKKFTLDAQLLGVSGGTSEAGLIAGYHLNRNAIIQVEATGGESNTSFFSYAKMKSSSVGVYYKQFVGNSFYVKSGINRRTIDYQYIWLWGDEEYSFQGNNIGLNLLIGNQWNWENFTLGCDWIGYNMPIASSISAEKMTSSYASTKTEMKDREDVYVKNGLGQGLKFYMGYTF